MTRFKLTESTDHGTFAGHKTFIVPTDIFLSTRHAKKSGKHWRTYLNGSDIHPSIRAFARSNPNKPIIFQDQRTGHLTYARYGKR